MGNNNRNHKTRLRTARDYAVITLAMLIGALGLNFFLVPNEIATGGTMGIASIVYWGTGIPVQNTYFVLNALLLIVALKILGWKFCAKTIYAVVVFTVGSTILQMMAGPDMGMLRDQKFMACIIGGMIMGTSIGLGLSVGGSTGGSDVVAAMINKYKNVSLGHAILFTDLVIITSSYVVLHSWEKVLYSYVLLFVSSTVVDYVVNSFHRSVQFFIISEKWEEIGEAINKIADRGCSTLNGNGFYSKRDIKVIYCIAKKTDAKIIFDLINEIDPDAFVAENSVIGVYGRGFDKVKGTKKISLDPIKPNGGKKG